MSDAPHPVLRKDAQGVRARIAAITPDLATKLLARNVHNRGVRASRVTQYAADLLAGDWQLNGESVKIDWDGRILDGQHRLMAVLEADRPMKTVLITGLDPRSQETMDQGLPRTSSDALKLRGEGDPHNLAAAARVVCIYLRDGRTFTAGRPTPTIGQVLRTLERCPELRDSLRFAQGLPNTLVPRSMVAALHFLFACVDDASATEFMRRLTKGGDGQPGVLHMRLKIDRERDQVQHARVKSILIVLAWNAWHRGEVFVALLPAKFPAIAGFRGSLHVAGRDGVSSQAAPRPAFEDSPPAKRSLPAPQHDAARAMLEAAS